MNKTKKILLVFLTLVLISFIVFLTFFNWQKYVKFPEIFKRQTQIDPSNVVLEKKEMFDNPDLYWQNWSWQDDIVRVSIESMDKDAGIVNGWIIEPEFLHTDEMKAFSLFCIPDKYSLLIKEGSRGKEENLGDPDIFLNAKQGDKIFTKCKNAECTSLGDECILYVQ